MNGSRIRGPADAAADVVVFADADALAEAAAERIGGFIRERAAARDTVTAAMAGGSTPAGAYRLLREMDLPWERVCAWVGDERFVPPGHPDNNGAMIGRLLLDHTDARFLRVPWREGRTAEQTAAEYQKTLLEALAHDDDGPRPDLVLAGMGDDGHTLSLFPGAPALDITDRWYAADRVDSLGAWRLTATYPLVHRAGQIYVLASGEGKAPALARVLEPGGGPPLPARRLMEGKAPVTWLVDEAAASRLAAKTG